MSLVNRHPDARVGRVIAIALRRHVVAVVLVVAAGEVRSRSPFISMAHGTFTLSVAMVIGAFRPKSPVDALVRVVREAVRVARRRERNRAVAELAGDLLGIGERAVLVVPAH